MGLFLSAAEFQRAGMPTVQLFLVSHFSALFFSLKADENNDIRVQGIVKKRICHNISRQILFYSN